MEYAFRDIEKKWQQYWREWETYKVSMAPGKPKYYVLDMFPYPSGAGLHVGHPLGYIASDIYSRYKRMKGFNVLHPMGYDAFGLPAEQYAIQTGEHPAVTTENNIRRYREQLDKIGFSFDWSRQVKTSDPHYYRWTQWIFLQLFQSWYNKDIEKAEPVSALIAKFEKDGNSNVHAACDEARLFSAEEWKNMSEKEQQLILQHYRLAYQRHADVWWCPELGTVLANDEVQDGVSVRGGHPVVRKSMKQWFLRITAYAQRLLDEFAHLDWPLSMKEMQTNWIGRSDGALIKFSLTPYPSPLERGVLPGYQTADKSIWGKLKEHARENRKEQTEAEEVLWPRVRNNKLGYKIRRQHAIEQFIADFICIERKLIIEIDGGIHFQQKEYDEGRTFVLNEIGYRVIRFSNEEVMTKTDWVCDEIKKALSFGEGLGEALIEVFTTRPDTVFGSTFMVLAPEHELVERITSPEQKNEVEKYLAYVKTRSERDRQAEVKKVTGAFTGAYALHPFTRERLPVWISEYVLAGYGTGAIMAVPAHDSRDFAFACYFNLPIRQVIVPAGGEPAQSLQEAHEAKEGKCIHSDFLNGLEVKDAIRRATEEVERLEIGKGKVNYKMRDAAFSRQRYWGEPFPVYYKDGIPYPMQESELPLELPAIDSYKPTPDGEAPLARAKNWTYAVKENLPVRQAGESYPLETDTMPGYAGSSWYFFRYMDPGNEKEFCSKEAQQYWQHVDLYVGGAEHATGHLLYARFWTHVLYDLGYVNVKEPFKKLVNQGMIQGVSAYITKDISESGLKMSGGDDNYENVQGKVTICSGSVQKSVTLPKQVKGILYSQEVIDPDRLLIEYPIDISVVENEIDRNRVPINLAKLVDLNKEYKDAVFVCSNSYWFQGEWFDFDGNKLSSSSDIFTVKPIVEKMSKSKFNVVNPDEIIEKYGADTFRMYEMFLGPIEQHKPWDTKGIDGVHRFLKKLWRLFYDDKGNWVVTEAEPSKEELKALHKTIRKVEEDTGRFAFNTAVSAFMIGVNELTDLKCSKRAILQELVKLLAPFAPHIAEELWEKLGNQLSVTQASFPECNPEYIKESTFNYPVAINGKTRGNIEFDLTLTQETIAKEVLVHELVQKYLQGKSPKKVIVVPGRMINVVL